MKNPMGENLVLYPPRKMARVDWSRRCAIHQFLFHTFLRNTSNGEMKYPAGHVQATTVTRDPDLRTEQDIGRFLSTLIFSCVCAVPK